MLDYNDFKKRLAEGQLKNTAAVNTDVDRSTITSEFSSMVLNLTNQGLIDLSTRLPIIKKRVQLDFQDNTNIYLLSTANVGVYLTELDGFDFNEEEFIAIHRIIDKNGKDYSIDTDNQIQTLSYNTIRFTDERIKTLGDNTIIEYQAKHELIDGNNSKLDIPVSLELPLQLFVASLFFSHMNNAESSAKGDSYFGAYLRHIGQDIQNNTSSVSEINDTSTRFDNNGFI